MRPARGHAATRAPACPVPAAYRHAFVRAADDTNLPLALLVSVAQIESQMTTGARSSADARGLLQVLPSTGTALRLDVSRPAENVLAGARYLRQLLDEFQSPDLALAAYNAGPTAVARADGAPTQETLEYVANVTALWRTLRDCY
jgi:soluble lytic murein transglycosylase-like protein